MSGVDRRSTVLPSIMEAVGGTPCVQLNRVQKELGLKCRVVAKCEFMNPGGSLKDRIGAKMVSLAESEGKLTPYSGAKIIEASSGNTGIGAAMCAAAHGYNMTVTMPIKMSKEKEVVLKALGTTVIRTPNRPSEDPESLISVAKRIAAEDPSTMYLDQYNNRGNPLAHYEGTGQEIYDQCQGKVDMVVIGTGTGGTITGVAKKLKELNPNIVVVGADPMGSILADPTKPAPGGAYQVEGTGYDFVPNVLDRSLVDVWDKTDDAESFALARKVQALEGMLVGGSSGSVLAAAGRAAKDLREDQTVVIIFPDSIRNYLTKFVDDDWMRRNGFMEGDAQPSVEDVQKENAELKAKIKELEDKLLAAK